jgi:uncharacterized membrane protein YgcG
MNNQRISSREAEELASGRVPSARRDLEPLAALMEDYRRAATTQSRIQPSAALAARLDLANTPEFPLEQAPDTDRSTVAVRAASGLFGVGLAVVIALGAASGAAALVGSAGMLPPDAQSAFDDLVSVIVPTEGAADETTDDDGEAPSDTLPNTGGDDATEGAAEPTPAPTPTTTPDAEESDDDNFGGRVAEIKDETESGREFGDQVSDEAKDNGNSNGNGNGNSGSNGNSGNSSGNSGSNGNSGNSGNGNSEKSNNGNGNSDKGNNGKND